MEKDLNNKCLKKFLIHNPETITDQEKEEFNVIRNFNLILLLKELMTVLKFIMRDIYIRNLWIMLKKAVFIYSYFC